MEQSYEPHIRPNVSRLEKWRTDITAMRSLSWPYQKIASWLWEHHQLRISDEAVRKFCQVRNINKGAKLRPMPSKRRFQYDDSEAIDIKR